MTPIDTALVSDMLRFYATACLNPDACNGEEYGAIKFRTREISYNLVNELADDIEAGKTFPLSKVQTKHMRAAGYLFIEHEVEKETAEWLTKTTGHSLIRL